MTLMATTENSLQFFINYFKNVVTQSISFDVILILKRLLPIFCLFSNLFHVCINNIKVTMIDSDTYFHRSCEHVSKVTATGCLLFDIKIRE